MKKFLFMLLSWTMLMAGAASISSCSDDDDDKENSNTSDNSTPSASDNAYVGTWVRNAAESSNGFDEDDATNVVFETITFSADGKFSAMSIDEESLNGTYSGSDADFKMTYSVWGEKMTIEKGFDLIDSEVTINGMKFTTKETISEFSVVVNDKKMTMTYVVDRESNDTKTTKKCVTVFDKK